MLVTRLWPLALILGYACSGVPLAPESDTFTGQGNTTSQSSGADLSIQLLTPGNHAILTQNDSTIGCPANGTRGFGFRAEFSWRLVGNATNVAGFNLFVKHRTSQFPWLDILVAEEKHVSTSCNGFVADHNLENWDWRVRALDNDGNWGPWSAPGVFHFEACRHPDGRPCTAPA